MRRKARPRSPGSGGRARIASGPTGGCRGGPTGGCRGVLTGGCRGCPACATRRACGSAAAGIGGGCRVCGARTAGLCAPKAGGRGGRTGEGPSFPHIAVGIFLRLLCGCVIRVSKRRRFFLCSCPQKHTMPLPLTLAFWGISAARRFHSASATVRPVMLRRAYFARVATYALVGVAVAAVNVSSGTVQKADVGSASVYVD